MKKRKWMRKKKKDWERFCFEKKKTFFFLPQWRDYLIKGIDNRWDRNQGVPDSSWYFVLSLLQSTHVAVGSRGILAKARGSEPKECSRTRNNYKESRICVYENTKNLAKKTFVSLLNFLLRTQLAQHAVRPDGIKKRTISRKKKMSV